ncbi:MAG: GNAT family N-acetyltransferase, partial [Pseudomonadota bacterium]
MNQTLRIRSARAAELPQLAELIRSRLPDLMKTDGEQQREQIEKKLATLLPDGCLQLAIENRKLVGVAAVDLDRARLLATYLDPELARFEITRTLLASVEQHAANFGIQRLSCLAKPQAWTFMERMGYRATDLPDPHQPIALSKRLLDDAHSWVQEIVQLHRTLGIPANYGVKRRLVLVPDSNNLVSIGNDIFGRDTRLDADTAEAWKRMQVEARRNDIELQLVSGFRSRNYQTGLIRKKLVANQ